MRGGEEKEKEKKMISPPKGKNKTNQKKERLLKQRLNKNLLRKQRLKPGPIVTATAVRSFSVRLALSSASCTT